VYECACWWEAGKSWDETQEDITHDLHFLIPTGLLAVSPQEVRRASRGLKSSFAFAPVAWRPAYDTLAQTWKMALLVCVGRDVERVSLLSGGPAVFRLVDKRVSE